MFQSPWDSGSQRQYFHICWRTRHNQSPTSWKGRVLQSRCLILSTTVLLRGLNGLFSGSCEIEPLFFVISVFRACKWLQLRPHPQHGSRPFCVNEKHHCPQQTLMTGTKTLTTSTLSSVQALVVSMKSFLCWLICGKSSGPRSFQTQKIGVRLSLKVWISF